MHRLVNVDVYDVNDLSDATVTSFCEAVSYVGAITNLDLSNVQEVRLTRYENAYIEGECISCNVNNHHVYYSLDSNQVVSVDLLCHEVGHAADFISARHDFTDDKVLYRHQSLAEAVAFYCQFRYLQNCGSVIKRTGSLGAFVYTYLAYLVCRYCIDKGIPLDQLDPIEAVEDELFHPLIAAYVPKREPMVAKHFLIERVRETQTRFPDLGSLIFHELNARLGIPLGLALLGIENLDLSRVSTMNVMSVELNQVLHAIDQRLLDKLSDMDTLVDNFISENDDLS